MSDLDEVLSGRARWAIVNGKVADVLAAMPSALAWACQCDPPYGLGSRIPSAEEIVAYLGGEMSLDTGGDFMGAAWEIPSVDEWRQVVRVLRPGAYCAAFGGSRTFDLLSVGARSAGLHLRDSISWNYAEGMPKPMTQTDVYIDKHLGMKRAVIGERSLTGNAAVSTKDKGGTYAIGTRTGGAKVIPVTEPASDEAKLWRGYGHSFRPGWEPCLLFQRPSGKSIAETILEYGTGALNIAGSRIGTSGGTRKVDPERYRTRGASLNGSADGSLNGGTKETIAAGRWPCNVALTHDERCVRVGEAIVRNRSGDVSGSEPSKATRGIYGTFGTRPGFRKYGDADGRESTELWACVPGCPIRLLDDQSGERPSTLAGRAEPDVAHDNPGDNGGASSFGVGNSRVYADTGFASRYYWSGKVSPREREYGCEHLPRKSASKTRGGGGGVEEDGYRNHHPTLKPIGLCRFVANLLRPPVADALLIVPWSGSGSEMIGALLSGWPRVIGIEMNAEYCEIARARIEAWLVRGDREDMDAVERERLGQTVMFAGARP